MKTDCRRLLTGNGDFISSDVKTGDLGVSWCLMTDENSLCNLITPMERWVISQDSQEKENNENKAFLKGSKIIWICLVFYTLGFAICISAR